MYIDSDKTKVQIERDVRAQRKKAKRKVDGEERAKRLAEILGEKEEMPVEPEQHPEEHSEEHEE